MCCLFPNKALIGFKTWRLRNWRTENQNYNTQACNDNFLCPSFSQVKWKMAVKNFVFVKENQFTWRSNYPNYRSYYHLTFFESNQLIVSVICALFIHKSKFNNYKIVKNTSSIKHNNCTTSCTQNEAERAEDFDWKVWLKKWPEMLKLAHA